MRDLDAVLEESSCAVMSDLCSEPRLGLLRREQISRLCCLVLSSSVRSMSGSLHTTSAALHPCSAADITTSHKKVTICFQQPASTGMPKATTYQKKIEVQNRKHGSQKVFRRGTEPTTKPKPLKNKGRSEVCTMERATRPTTSRTGARFTSNRTQHAKNAGLISTRSST